MYPGNKRKKVWREEKDRLLKMTLEERRKEYIRDYVPLKDIPTWMEEMKSKTQSDEENTQEPLLEKKNLSEKVSLYRGDITVLEIDAIVNAVNWNLPSMQRLQVLILYKMLFWKNNNNNMILLCHMAIEQLHLEGKVLLVCNKMVTLYNARYPNKSIKELN